MLAFECFRGIWKILDGIQGSDVRRMAARIDLPADPLLPISSSTQDPCRAIENVRHITSYPTRDEIVDQFNVLSESKSFPL